MNRRKLVNFFCLFYLVSIIGCSKGNDDNTVDNENPRISCQNDIFVSNITNQNTVVVNFITPTATDNDSATVTQISGLASGAQYPEGTTTNVFRATDPSGNSATCSFKVIVSSDSQPNFANNDPKPAGKKWTKVSTLSDEFDGNTFDDTKWHRNASTDGFGWIGRAPGLFKQENANVNNGNLEVTVEKFDVPQTVNGNEYTHGGAIVRSKEVAKSGYYYECRMKANSTVMSSTFWIAYKNNCTTGPFRKLELDIQECVGRVHSGTSSWATDYANIYASNTWRHQRNCDTGANTPLQWPGKTVLTESNNSRYFVYGCWWKSPTEILFYLDGEYTHSITPGTDFDIDGHITMAIETYDWNPVNDAGSLFDTGSVDQLTTKYDWVRTWKLEDN